MDFPLFPSLPVAQEVQISCRKQKMDEATSSGPLHLTQTEPGFLFVFQQTGYLTAAPASRRSKALLRPTIPYPEFKIQKYQCTFVISTLGRHRQVNSCKSEKARYIVRPYETNNKNILTPLKTWPVQTQGSVYYLNNSMSAFIYFISQNTQCV